LCVEFANSWLGGMMPQDSDRHKEALVGPQVTATEANLRLGYLFSRARFAGERTVITHRGRPIAAIVPIADLDRLTGGETSPDDGASRAA
jgi:prevent-host-death family protein